MNEKLCLFCEHCYLRLAQPTYSEWTDEGEATLEEWLLLAESAFAFWDNEDDAIYDDL